MASQSVNDTISQVRAEGILEKAQAIVNLLGAAQEDELTKTSMEIAAWAASDLIEQVLVGGRSAPLMPADTLRNCLRKVEAITDVMMAAKDPPALWTYNASWAIRGLINDALEASQQLGSARV